jgi:hypothetical protein
MTSLQIQSMQLLIAERDTEIAEHAVMVSQLHQRIATLELPQVQVQQPPQILQPLSQPQPQPLPIIQQPSAASTSSTQQVHLSSIVALQLSIS